MRKARLVVGGVVQVPVIEFAPMRSGWNGWLFQAGIIKKVGKSSKTGKTVAEIEYPKRNYGQRIEDFRGNVRYGERETLTKIFGENTIFEFSLYHSKELIKHPREYWCGGCYDADTEYLIDKGIL